VLLAACNAHYDMNAMDSGKFFAMLMLLISCHRTIQRGDLRTHPTKPV